MVIDMIRCPECSYKMARSQGSCFHCGYKFEESRGESREKSNLHSDKIIIDFDKTEAQIEKIDLPDKFFINECKIQKGIVSFLCPNCEEDHTLKAKLFFPQDEGRKNIIIQTDKIVSYLRSKAPGWVIGFIVAQMIVFIIMAGKGGYNKAHLFLGVGIWMVLKAIINAKLTKRLPVWLTNCSKCQEKLFLASNGKIFSVLTSKATKGLDLNPQCECEDCRKSFPKYELKLIFGKLLCPDCQKKTYGDIA